MGDLAAAVQHVEIAGLALGAEIADRGAKAGYLAPAPLAEHAGQAFLQPVDDHAARAGHGAHQVMELALDGGQIVEDVGVIELQVVEHGRARAVVD